MDYAEVTKLSNVRNAETDYTGNTSVTTDANAIILDAQNTFFHSSTIKNRLILKASMANDQQFSKLTVTSDATDANVTDGDLPTSHSDSTLTKLAQLFNYSR